MQKMTVLCEKNYIDALGVCLLVNTPWAFTAIWTALKPFMGED